MHFDQLNPEGNGEGNGKILEWGGYLLMSLMIENAQRFEPTLNGDDKYLEPILMDLIKNNWTIAGVTGYEPTLVGRKAYEAWIKKLYTLNERLEVFCGVDLSAGEFAYEKFYDFKSDEEWRVYLEQSRFVDLRIVVAQEYRLDPGEFVFMSFLNEGRWNNLEQGSERSGWQFDLVSGKLLEEINTIVANTIKKDELGYTHEGKTITGEAVLMDVISRGEELLVKLSQTEGGIKRGMKHGGIKDEHLFSKSYEKEAGLDDAYKL